MSVYDEYEMTIGIECHVQLATATKLFSPASNDARDAAPNTTVHPIDYGLPGMLPTLNRRAVELAVRAGAALSSDVAHVSRFDRKHYFYPDLPKGYQTSQLYQPLIIGGHVDVPRADAPSLRVRIHHAHMEEDAGKLTHYGDHSLVDLNRAGTPLIEIVSEPDIHSAADARLYALELYRLMTYAGVTHGDLYHGNMRFDVNISVAKKGAEQLGTRAEIKNLNSFRSVEKAASYEFIRQIDVLEAGDVVVQETRGWDDDRLVTTSQRSKEDAEDYRYMPDADIPPIILSDDDIARMQADMPALPQTYREAWQSLELDPSVVDALLDTQDFAVAVSAVQESADDAAARRVAHWFVSALDAGSADVPRVPAVAHLIELAAMVEASELSSTAAKEIFNDILTSDAAPRAVAESKNLLQLTDLSAIEAIVDDVIADPASAASIADIRAGRDKAIGYLVGQVMKRSAGKANPALAQKMIKERIL